MKIFLIRLTLLFHQGSQLFVLILEHQDKERISFPFKAFFKNAIQFFFLNRNPHFLFFWPWERLRLN